MSKIEKTNILFAKNITELKKKAGKNFTSEILQIYSIQVNFISSIKNLRSQTMRMYLVTMTSIVTAIVVVSQISLLRLNQIILLIGIASAVGLFFSVYFRYLLRSYNTLIETKIQTAKHIETLLPLRILKHEYQELYASPKSKYIPFSQMEKEMTVVFVIIYICILVICMGSLINFTF